MKIKALRLTAFGKFHMDSPIELSDGLNIIRGENEAGKSTVVAFILGMLYGFKKEGKSRVSRTPEFDRYRPWSGTDYRGSLTYKEGGRVYRVERSFDPDWVRIYDDSTGEDVTFLFSQDHRKEYDFAQRHLGLSQKEFRNTVWIGQLGSAQEPGLGTEIQGKLQAILEGGSEDVSLSGALLALRSEADKLKSPKSTTRRLDLVRAEVQALRRELQEARDREEAVREAMAEAAGLTQEKARLEREATEGERALEAARYALLHGVLSKARELEAKAESLRERIRAVQWAAGLDLACEEALRSIREEARSLEDKAAGLQGELGELDAELAAARSRLSALARVEALGVDEATVAGLYPTKYSLAKGQAVKNERAANQARQDLRAVEEEGRLKRYPPGELDADVLRKAEDYNETYLLAEKERGRKELEVEKAKAAAAALRPGGMFAAAYGLALVILGAAVVCALLGLPAGWALFAASVGVFVFGLFRQRAANSVRREALRELEEKGQELARQAERVEEARAELAAYLSGLGAGSIEELRSYAREVAIYRTRLKAARDNFEKAQAAWFEASAEFSAVEKQLQDLLRSAGLIGPGEAITDGVVGALRSGLREVETLKGKVRDLERRRDDLSSRLRDCQGLLENAQIRERQMLDAAGVLSSEELTLKIEAKKQHAELTRSREETLERAKALLSGRKISEVEQEIAELAAKMGASPSPGLEVSDREFEGMRKAQEERLRLLSDVNVRLAALDREIKIKTEGGRPSPVIEEELSRQEALEKELSIEHAALVLACETLEELSSGVRREFAPALSRRVSHVLSTITGSRYTKVMVSPDLAMTVVHPESGVQTPIESLSGGTLDQCYFALRVATAEIVTKREEFPFFLDDSFVQYDDKRLAGALSVLGALASRHQILLFSCHGREEDIADRMNIPYNRVVL